MDERATESFGYWVRRRRKALDLTQAALAEKVSCSQAAIKKIEAEERRPSRALAQRLAEHLGIPPPQRPAFVQAARGAEGVAPAAPPERGAASPLVGRDAQLALLSERLAGAAAGHGETVLLQGEPGIGKSRLMQEAAALARQRHMAVCGARCYEIERAIAYQPLIELAAQACALLPQPRLQQVAPVLLAEVAALVPAVAERMPGLPPLSAHFPEARQARLFQALAQLFDTAAAGQGLLLALDDVQWADPASLRFLHYYGRQLAGRGVLLLCACRDDEVDSPQELTAWIASLHAPHGRVLLLPRLSLPEVELLLQRGGPGGATDASLAPRLLAESEGNPFFLWSLLQAWGGQPPAGPAGSAPLPDALRDSVRARLAPLPQEQRALLDLAAVLGLRFHFERLLAFSRLPAGEFLQALEALVRHRLLREEPAGGFHDFSHDKVREVVYGEIGAARRVLLHRQAAELLEGEVDAGGRERAGHLAEHCARGELWARALHYLVQAADQAMQLFATREALQWFDRAAALLDARPEAADGAARLALLERRAAARAQVGQLEGAVADFQQAIALAHAQGEPARAREILIGLGMACRRADRYEQAIDCLERACAAARADGDERQVADCLYHLGTVAWSNGRNDRAIACHQEAVAVCERLGLRDLVAVQAFHGRGEAFFAQARPRAAIACFERALQLAREIGDRGYEAENLMMIGWASLPAFGLGDAAQALQRFDAALAIVRSADLHWHLGPTVIGRAHALAAQGLRAEARAEVEQVLPELAALALVRYQVMAYDALGTLLLEEGDPGGAERRFERALLLAGGTGLRYWQARLQSGAALARVRRGACVDSAALQAALEGASQCQELWLVPRCLEALAEAALAQGDARTAKAHADRLLALAARGRLRSLARLAAGLRRRARAAALEQ